MSFQPLNPPRYNYVDAKPISAEQMATDNLTVYIRMLEDRIFQARIALAEGKPASEVVRILQG